MKFTDEKIINTVYETYDYSKFKLLQGNRSIKESNIIRLKRSIYTLKK
jgi:hypothetical protein